MSKQNTKNESSLSQRLAQLWEEQGGAKVLDILETLAQEQTDPDIKQALGAVRASVRSGTALSAALRKQQVFGAELIDAVAAGEKHGDLVARLRKVASPASNPAEPELLTLNEAARFLYTSKPTMHRMLQRGELQGLKVGRQWRFRKADLVAHMERTPPTVALASTVELDAVLEHMAIRLSSRRFMESVNAGDDETKVVALANSLFVLAIQERATDVHFEPQRENFQVRLRVDGVLVPAVEMPMALHRPLIDRLKVMSDADITIRNLPQDGRINLRMGEQAFDARLCICPTIHGETVAVRILVRDDILVSLDKYSLAPQRLEQLRGWMHRPCGLILITGPTGSGKTSTLYSCLLEVAGPDKKTLTIEDPVEVPLPHTTQMHVNRKAGLTFATGLRAILRQDPDVIFVGEICDLEVAQIAIQSVLTGHLVIASMHTDSAAGTVMQLLEMGMEPFLLNQALLGIINQRLVRRLEAPGTPETADAVLLRQVRDKAMAGGFDPGKKPDFRAASPSEQNRTGYRGRVPIQEVLEWNHRLGEELRGNPTQESLTRAAVETGMHTLFAEGVRKAVEHHTTIEEVTRVVGLNL